MEELNRANEILSPLKNVRILYLPPFTVAASHAFGPNPEDMADKPLNEFIQSARLPERKPDFRIFGFNNPSPAGNEAYGYEFWVTIPEDMPVPAPLQKKRFAGGLYAAHCIKMGDFQEWQLLCQWVDASQEYDYEAREPLGMDGCMEEHLNAHSVFTAKKDGAQFVQLDLLIPIKKRQE